MVDFVAMSQEILGERADVNTVQALALKLAEIMPVETPDASELLRRGGEWLGAARSWILWHRHNGDSVTWGSADVLRPPFTTADVEDLAAHVAAAAMRKQPGEQRLLDCLQARWKAERTVVELKSKLVEWQNRLAPHSAFGSLKERSTSVRSEMLLCIERLK